MQFHYKFFDYQAKLVRLDKYICSPPYKRQLMRIKQMAGKLKNYDAKL